MARDPHAGVCETRTGDKRCGLQDSRKGSIVSRRPLPLTSLVRTRSPASHASARELGTEWNPSLPSLGAQFTSLDSCLHSPTRPPFRFQKSRSVPTTDTALDGPVPPLTVTAEPSPNPVFSPSKVFPPRFRVIPPWFSLVPLRFRVHLRRTNPHPSRIKVVPPQSGVIPAWSRVYPARINLVPEVRRLVRAGITLFRAGITPVFPGATPVPSRVAVDFARKSPVFAQNGVREPGSGPDRPVRARSGRAGGLVPGVGPVGTVVPFSISPIQRWLRAAGRLSRPVDRRWAGVVSAS